MLYIIEYPQLDQYCEGEASFGDKDIKQQKSSYDRWMESKTPLLSQATRGELCH